MRQPRHAGAVLARFPERRRGVVVLHAIEERAVPVDDGEPLGADRLLQQRRLELEARVLVERGALGRQLGDDRVRPAVSNRLLVEALLRLGEHDAAERLEKIVGHVRREAEPRGARRDLAQLVDHAGRLLEVAARQLNLLGVAPLLRRGEVRERAGHVEEDAGALKGPVGLVYEPPRREGVVPAEDDLGLVFQVHGAKVVLRVRRERVVAELAVANRLGAVRAEPLAPHLLPPALQVLEEGVSRREPASVDVPPKPLLDRNRLGRLDVEGEHRRGRLAAARPRRRRP
mmetsp:Transcript_8833/g.25999  ORF Transcript_8833/g.25999 Transcript_8833/m.25999 type:complete len:287 (+) Transcript_8833:985-1845(+)